MEEIRFEWDARKATSNRRKHGVSFEIAAQIFNDVLTIVDFEGHEHGEERWRAIGQAGRAILIVSYTIREDKDGEICRIISAHRAQPHELRRYEGDS